MPWIECARQRVVAGASSGRHRDRALGRPEHQVAEADDRRRDPGVGVQHGRHRRVDRGDPLGLLGQHPVVVEPVADAAVEGDHPEQVPRSDPHRRVVGLGRPLQQRRAALIGAAHRRREAGPNSRPERPLRPSVLSCAARSSASAADVWAPRRGGALGRPLELDGDLLVGPDRGGGEMPGARIGRRVRGERPVRAPALGGRRAAVDDAAKQRDGRAGSRRPSVSSRPAASHRSSAASSIPRSRQAAITGTSARSDDAAATSSSAPASGPAAATRRSSASPSAPPGAGGGSIGARPRRCSSESIDGSSSSASGLPSERSSSVSATGAASSAARAAPGRRVASRPVEPELLGGAAANGSASSGRAATSSAARRRRGAGPRSRGTRRRGGRANGRRRRGSAAAVASGRADQPEEAGEHRQALVDRSARPGASASAEEIAAACGSGSSASADEHRRGQLAEGRERQLGLRLDARGRARPASRRRARAAAVSRAVLPIPGSPRRTSAPPRPDRAPCSSASIRSSSASLPTSTQTRTP